MGTSQVGKGGLPPLWLNGIRRAGVNHPSQPVRLPSLCRSKLGDPTESAVEPAQSNKGQDSLTTNPSLENFQPRISAPSSALSARSTSAFRPSAHRKAIQPPPPAPQTFAASAPLA